MFTTAINSAFTVVHMGVDRIAVARYAVERAEREFGWNKAAFARELFGYDQRQRINAWLKRGLPPAEYPRVAGKLGLTVEELLSAGEKEPPPKPLPQEAVDFAREWLRLPPYTRNNIRTLVLGMLESGRDGGSEGLAALDRPLLHRRGGA